jgi:hypothetical protein
LDPGPDGFYGTPDDVISSFSTEDFNSTDAEGVTFANGELFIADGLNNEIYRLNPGPNGIFDGVAPAGDDQVTSFDTFGLGLEDPEGIAFNPDNGNLYIGGKTRNIGTWNFDTLLEVTTSGVLVQLIDVSAVDPNRQYAKQLLSGLAYAPSSQNPALMNIYIADRGVDNNSNPSENDGRLYELTLPGINPQSPPTAADDSATTIQDTAVSIDVAANDTDPNGNLDPPSANTVCPTCSLPASGALTNNGDGTFNYAPDPGFFGSDDFVYEICDTDSLCDTATVTIDVVVNDPPIANDDNASTLENTPVNVDVALNDSDPNGNMDPASANTICTPSCSLPSSGTLTNNGDGTFIYTPNPGFLGSDSFAGAR